jgi:hypothetical protein
MKRELHNALALVASMSRHGIDAVVAGGAARDTHLGLEPKDYDIIVLGSDDYAEAVAELLCDQDIQFTTYGVNEYSGGPAASHLNWVIKAHTPLGTIDIIQQRSRPGSPRAAVECFDVSLNMAWFSPDGTVVLHTDFPQPGGEVKILRTCDFPAARIPYLASKHPGYVWPTFSEVPA